MDRTNVATQAHAGDSQLAGTVLKDGTSHATIAVFGERNLGSLRDLEISVSRAWLNSLAGTIDDPFLIADLDSVQDFGAALLGCLVEAARILRSRNRRLVVCGAHRDITRCTRVDLLFLVLPRRLDALQFCAAECASGENGGMAAAIGAGGETQVRHGSYEEVSTEYYDKLLHPTCANFRSASELLIHVWLSALAGFDTRIVEVGAGKSIVAPWLVCNGRPLNSLAITDASPGMLEHSVREGWGKRGARLIVSPAETLPFGGGTVDLVVASLADPYNNWRFYREVRRVLKNSGRVISTMPSHVWADRFRRCEGIGTVESAIFKTERLQVALPSLVLPVAAQKCLIESSGLHVHEVAAVRPSQVASSELSPKLRFLLADDEPFLVGYLARNSSRRKRCAKYRRQRAGVGTVSPDDGERPRATPRLFERQLRR